jgi:hypothetical protein
VIASDADSNFNPFVTASAADFNFNLLVAAADSKGNPLFTAAADSKGNPLFTAAADSKGNPLFTAADSKGNPLVTAAAIYFKVSYSSRPYCQQILLSVSHHRYVNCTPEQCSARNCISGLSPSELSS